jgi:hypothetical protein
MLGELSGAASQISGSMSLSGKAVDLVASALNLPDPVKDIAKIIVGAFLMDVPGIISGATGLLSEVMEVARTDYWPSANPVRAGAGYAAPHRSRPVPPPGSSTANEAFDRLSSKLSATQKEYDELMDRVASGEKLDQQDQFKLQQLQQKLEQMTRLLSSILKHQHEMALVVIQNLGR